MSGFPPESVPDIGKVNFLGSILVESTMGWDHNVDTLIDNQDCNLLYPYFVDGS